MRKQNTIPSHLHLLMLLLGCLYNGELCMSCSESERLALVKFKAGLQDPHQLLSSWEGDDCCTWAGVHCDNETWHVVSLDLQYHHLYHGLSNGGRLSGEINPSLFSLKHLNHLDLSSNHFKGTEIPSFIGSLTGLSYLNLSNAGFIGRVPPQLGNLTSLIYLDLNSFYSMHDLHVDDNFQWLSFLSSLQYLDMSGVNLAKISSDNLFHAVNMLPALSVLILPNCHLHCNNQINSTFPLWLTNSSRLVYLDLWFNHFHGVIPEAIGQMKSLEVIQLGFNHFAGPLPTSIRDLCNLHTLDFSFNNLSEDTSTLSRIFSGCAGDTIETLNLRNSKLKGELSGWLGMLKAIITLDLSKNSLYGPIPISIGNLSNLRTLYLTSNRFNGSLPESFGQLSELKILDIAYNSISGVISQQHFANLSSLDTLSMSYNPLVVNISRDWVPPFHLLEIALVSCQLGPEFPAWLRTQKDYSVLDLSNTGITGSLPDWFWDLPHSIALLDLSNNQITGTIPKSLKFFSLCLINLRSNKFEGPLPPLPSNALYVDLSDNSFSGDLLPILGENIPTLGHLYLSNNLLNGTLSASICNFQLMQVIDISNNFISGELPGCWQNLFFLVALNLANNKIYGEIPVSLGSLKLIEVLHLGNNNLSGEIPLPLRNCKILVTLDLGGNKLSGNIPAWIGESMPLLRILRLRANMLQGDIPGELSNLASLQILDLANNNLSGVIPQSFGNLSAMQLTDEARQSILDGFHGLVITSIGNYSISGYTDSLSVITKGMELEYSKTLEFVTSMDLSSNQLSGEIPQQLGNLNGIQNLNLSGNHLIGVIPDSIGDLVSLESFDLSRNELSGEIPPSISFLTSLSHLNLSYNNLWGRIPTGNQLQTLDDPSIYIGNRDLCGPPLTVKCGHNETLAFAVEGDDSDENATLWLLFGGAVGYALGLWAVCICLFIKEAWRNSYFDVVDYMHKKLLAFTATSIYNSAGVKDEIDG
ncbi:receptor-like protein EIX2 [Dioscorea cayenensis subsp. rotundata]|uniref:Receptor-like protein EIX2 n=1 Tax=Dioscorea cayennensis subsp. rotundata TaxID=55577 RepID=A0AB40AYM5_DIOCR|nr:receptor-like protein EIX2 [Dioscorea cayenensis subsp. rotundata]